MIVDAQIHVWEADRLDRPWPKAEAQGRTQRPQRATPLSADECIAEMDKAGVHHAILVPPSWEGDRNDVAIRAALTYPGRFSIMGRIPQTPTAVADLPAWRQQTGMLGIRVILADGTAWREDGINHWLWSAAEAAGIPLMLAPAGAVSLIGDIARRHPALKVIVDHMGALVDRRGASAFSGMAALIELSALPNVAVKATCLPAYSNENRPWADILPFLKRIFDSFGPDRLFWGSDLSRLACPYKDLVDFFLHELDWLSGQDRRLIMGDALISWLDVNLSPHPVGAPPQL